MRVNSSPLLVSLGLFVSACGGSAAPAATPPAAEPTELDLWNQSAREGAVQDTLHGTIVEDPYRSLESDTPETQEWVNNQTNRTEEALAPLLSEERNSRIAELLSIGSIGSPVIGGDWIFYRKREGDREQPILFGRREVEVDGHFIPQIHPSSTLKPTAREPL